jgi:putative spermidine/putrescine transport system permease protein
VKGHEFSRRALGIWTFAVATFALAPLFCIAAVSFTARDYISLPTAGFSLRWYARIATRPEFISAALNSLFIAAAAAIAAIVLGTLAALAVTRWKFFLRDTMMLLVTAPLFVPAVMTGLAILFASGRFGWTEQLSRLLVAHSILTIPYTFRAVMAALAGFDVNQELAARNLGAPPAKAFMLIAVPQLAPGLLAGLVFAFIVSFDNVSLSIFLSGTKVSTLPVELYVYSAANQDPMIASVSVVMILVSLLAVLLLERWYGLQSFMQNSGGR